MSKACPFSATLQTEIPVAGDPYVAWPHHLAVTTHGHEIRCRYSILNSEIEINLDAQSGSDWQDAKISIRNLDSSQIESAVVDWVARRFCRYGDAANHAAALEILDRIDGASAAARAQITERLTPAAV